MVTKHIETKAVELLGAAEAVSRPPKKDTLMSYRNGHVYFALKLVSEFDKESGRYLDPVPKIVAMFDGKYVRMPVDSILIKDLGEFLLKLSEAVDGVKVEKDIDMDSVWKKLDQFRREIDVPQE